MLQSCCYSKMQIRPTYPKNLNKGNLTADPYQGITHISYDVLNKTDTTVITSGSTYITYTYDAGGNLLRKKAYNSGVLTQTDYIDGFVYTGTGTQTLSYAPMPEGRLLTTSLTQEYVITDPQGNARVSFQNNSGVAKVTQENSYYGYGLQMPGSLVGFSSPPNKHMYNGGSEWQNDTKSVNAGVPDYYQTFYRNYDPTLGRFIGVDPMAEGSASMGVYHYAGDNPVMGNDPGGDMLANPNAEKYADLDKEEQGAFMGSDLGGGGGGSIYTNPADAIGRNSDPNWMNDGQFDDPGPFSDDHGKAGMQFWAGAEMSGGVLDPTVPHSYGQNAQDNQEVVSDPTVGAAPGTNQVRMQGHNSAFDEDPDSWDWGWYKDFRSLFASFATDQIALNNFKQFLALVAGESSNNLKEAAGIADVILNRMKYKHVSFSDPNWAQKIKINGFDAYQGDIYNDIMGEDMNDLLEDNSGGYNTRIQGALMAYNDFGCEDYSNGAYFFNRSYPDIGANWNRVNSGIWVITGGQASNTTFMKYTPNPVLNPYGKVWP
jgi:RHS repeat-associated protein